MNRSWFVYYGYKLGLSRSETLQTTYGEFMDLMACDAISRGDAQYRRPKVRMTMEELLQVR